MNISEAARRSGLTSKAIRYYEDIGLIAPARPGDNGYRQYETACRQLLALFRDKGRQSRHARDLVLEKSAKLQARIDQLRAMQAVLTAMASRCHGDEGPECAILDDLAGIEGEHV